MRPRAPTPEPTIAAPAVTTAVGVGGGGGKWPELMTVVPGSSVDGG